MKLPPATRTSIAEPPRNSSSIRIRWFTDTSSLSEPLLVGFENIGAAIENSATRRLLFIRLEFELQFHWSFQLPRLEFPNTRNRAAGGLTNSRAGVGMGQTQSRCRPSQLFHRYGLRFWLQRQQLVASGPVARQH